MQGDVPTTGPSPTARRRRRPGLHDQRRPRRRRDRARRPCRQRRAALVHDDRQRQPRLRAGQRPGRLRERSGATAPASTPGAVPGARDAAARASTSAARSPRAARPPRAWRRARSRSRTRPLAVSPATPRATRGVLFWPVSCFLLAWACLRGPEGEMPMKKLAALPAALLLALAALPAAADHPGSATTADIQRVQADLYNLEEAVRNLPTTPCPLQRVQGPRRGDPRERHLPARADPAAPARRAAARGPGPPSRT